MSTEIPQSGAGVDTAVADRLLEQVPSRPSPVLVSRLNLMTGDDRQIDESHRREGEFIVEVGVTDEKASPSSGSSVRRFPQESAEKRVPILEGCLPEPHTWPASSRSSTTGFDGCSTYVAASMLCPITRGKGKPGTANGITTSAIYRAGGDYDVDHSAQLAPSVSYGKRIPVAPVHMFPRAWCSEWEEVTRQTQETALQACERLMRLRRPKNAYRVDIDGT